MTDSSTAASSPAESQLPGTESFLPDEPRGATIASEAPIVDDGQPPVVVAVIVDEASDHLTGTLASIAAQDYPSLTVLVIDAAGEAPIADQVAAVLPDAFVHRMTGRPGRAAARNQALELVTGAPFFLFVMTGVELEPGCTSALVEELYRSNAGIVSPKVVDGNDPRRLRQVGMGADQFGVQVDLVEPGEFDQEQYDTVRDVFVAPDGAQLVRADLLRAIGGFDPVMTRYGADLDLCWRAHVAGARVVVVPRAVVRSFERPGDVDERRRQLGRARLRTLLVASSKLRLARVLPLALLLLLAEAAYSVVAGRRRQARDALGAIGSNIADLGAIRARRRVVAETRGVSDGEVHELQMSGSARLSGFFRGQFDVGDRVVGFAGAFRDSFTGRDAGSFRDGFIISVAIGLVLVFGSRRLIGAGVVPTGQFLEVPSAGALLGEWLGDWRSVGVGGVGSPPTAFGVLGILRVVFFWAPGLLDTLLAVGPLLIGPIGAWRLARPFGTIRGSALAALAYAANPLAIAAMSAGRWDALVVYGAGPFLVGSALRVLGVSPFGDVGGLPGPGVETRSVAVRLVRYGLLTALVATFVPAVVIVSGLICIGLIVGNLVMAKPRGSLRMLGAAAVGVIVPAVLHGAWTFDVLRRFDWDWLTGPPSPEAAFDSLADLVRFAPGAADPHLLTIGILAAASLSLVIGMGSRLDSGIRAWSIAVVAWGLVWSQRRGWIGIGLPDAEMLLVPAAVGVSMAVGSATRAVEIDLAGFRFGWRQVAAFLGVVAMAGAGILLLRESYGGRWGMPEQSYANTTELLAQQIEGPTRVLWIGPPSVLPTDPLRSERGITYAVANGGVPDALGRWMPGNYGLNAQIGQQLDLAVDAQTVRVGHLLAPYGIDFVVVVPQLAPAPYVGQTHEAPAGILAALLGQLDLQRVAGVSDFTVFRNEAARGPVVGLETDVTSLPNSSRVFLDTDLSIGERLDADAGPGSWSWRERTQAPDEPAFVPPRSVLVSSTAGGWTSATPGVSVEPTEGGLLAVIPGDASAWSIERSTPWLRWVALLGQAVVIAAGVAVARSEDVDR